MSLKEEYLELLRIDTERVTEFLARFVRERTAHAGLGGVVVGLSGGVDSATSAFLGARALGPENVLGVMLPYKESSPDSTQHAREVVDKLGIQSLEIDITPMIDAYFELFPDADRNRRGNKMARERMSILFDQSAARNALVLGTSNKTELLLGYGTLFGDTASSINPLGDLYKTQVFQLAEYLGVPEVIVRKVPTADLWTGQSDEGELGFRYRDVDVLLHHMIDLGLEKPRLVKMGFDPAFIDKALRWIEANRFKGEVPIIARFPEGPPKPA